MAVNCSVIFHLHPKKKTGLLRSLRCDEMICFVWISALFFLLAISSAQAQQNLFNIPSGDITRKGKVFYQHQLNIYSSYQVESKSHFVYGLDKNWDAGFNFVDLPISFRRGTPLFSSNDNPNSKPFYPLLLGTLQKKFDIGHHFQINVGTQAGGNIPNGGEFRFAYMHYGLLRYNLPGHKGFFIAGPYYANDVFFGPSSTGRHVGWKFGYEIPVSEKFYLMGDFVSGQNKKSVSTFGGVYNVSRRVQICIAALLAFPNEKLTQGVVLELNWYTYNFKEAAH